MIRLTRNDRTFIMKAVEIAKQGIEKGYGPFGALITRKGKIITEANNKVVLSSDPTAHAEILAIRKASEILETHDLSDCVLYCSCEPCPMCLGAVYWAGIKKIIYASGRKDAEMAGFSDSMIYDEIMLEPGNRSISFICVSDAGGQEVFAKWEEFDDRIPY
ncbi:MAG TPA: nucleoside deaminase [Bacteroidales bacterium]|nr:nucleoside deaminase [Bacteroidales bacterium]HRW84622.1 nucleoside deaminase [Bacteroidales bacterium]